MNPEWFKDRLREFRGEACLSRQQLADKAGLKLNVIRDIEQGVNKPSWDTVIALCKALGVKCDDFMQPPSSESPPIAVGRPRKAAADVEVANVDQAPSEAAETKPGPATGKRNGRKK